jgi:hypothetical protein
LDGIAKLQHQEFMGLTAELPRTIKQVGFFCEGLVIRRRDASSSKEVLRDESFFKFGFKRKGRFFVLFTG